MSTILTAPAQLGDTKLIGQVAVLDIAGLRVHAPNKTREWFKLDITAACPPEGCPSAKDVSWLIGRGVKFYVVGVFPEGTFDLTAIESREAQPEPVR